MIYIQLGDREVSLANGKNVVIAFMAEQSDISTLTVRADYRGIEGYATLTETPIYRSESAMLSAIEEHGLINEAQADLIEHLNNMIYSLGL